MNARQKAKHWKKKYQELWEDYIYSAMAASTVMEQVTEKIKKFEESKVTCVVNKQYPDSEGIDDAEMFSLYDDITYDPTFRQAVVFEGHTDPDTGKYILEAKLTVVIPEVDDENLM